MSNIAGKAYAMNIITPSNPKKNLDQPFGFYGLKGAA